MKRKIISYYVILVVIGVSITGFFISQLTQTLYRKQVEEKLLNISNLIRSELLEDFNEEKKMDYDQAARIYAKLLNTHLQTGSLNNKSSYRITFIDFNGKVLGESNTDYLSMENHLMRKEVQQAIHGKIGKDIRFSRTLNIDFLYVALPMETPQVIVRLSLPLVQMKEIGQLILIYTITGIIAGLLMTGLLALKFSSAITRPINELITISKEISLGDYSKRLNIRSQDELGQLADTFNEMASRLEDTVADLIDKNLKVETIMNSMLDGIVAVDGRFKLMLINAKAREMFNFSRNSDIVGLNIIEVIRNNQINSFIRETVEKNISMVNEIVIGPPQDKVFRVYTNPTKPIDSNRTNSGAIAFIQDITNIKKLEQIRTEFVSNVTHELKTPLTSIKGFVETLRAGAIKDPEIADKFLEIIDIESERLYTLINDILQLSEIENRQKDSNINPHDLRSIIEEVISILQGVADRKNITLVNKVNEDITINVNKDRIKQMLINLMDNGIKYNVENGNVVVDANKSDGKIVITVKDTGIGIAHEHLSRIFERFYRVDKGRSREQGGTGLGLSIVKHIVNLYSGDIKINSEPGRGTEFIIRLPV